MLAASSAAGVGAGSAYRAFASAQPQATQPANATLSVPASDLGTGPSLFTTPGSLQPLSVPGTESAAVAEPSSALILVAGVLSVVLIRRATQRKMPRQHPPAAGLQP